MLTKMIKKAKGFTLIELMIVIAIIGILAAIAVPMFLTYRQRSYDAAAKAIAHNLKADNGNLNADLGVWGHTDGVLGTLGPADPAAGIGVYGKADDANAFPGLAIAATKGGNGARLIGTSATGISLDIGTAIGRNMIAQVTSNVLANNTSACNIFTRHYRGEIAFGIDSDVENTLYMVPNQGWPVNAGIMATMPATPTVANDDLNNVAGGGQASQPNWQPATE